MRELEKSRTQQLGRRTDGFESVTVFAAPKFLEAWRKVQSNGLSDKVDLHEADLASFDGAALARHPAILDLLNMNAATTC